jgi:hypothetical protein
VFILAQVRGNLTFLQIEKLDRSKHKLTEASIDVLFTHMHKQFLLEKKKTFVSINSAHIQVAKNFVRANMTQNHLLQHQKNTQHSPQPKF